MSRPTLLIDFDGTLSDYHGWKGPEILGPPIANSRKACLLLSKSFRLVCFTTRDREGVERWLRANGFPLMKVTNFKEPAHLIIDDRAICFDGSWTDSLLNQIHSFAPHWQHANESPSPVSQQSEPEDPTQTYPVDL